MTRNLATYFVAALTAFAATTSANAAAADLIILESNVSSLAAGSVVSESKAVTLAGSARLVMIAPDGTTRSVRGPYSGPLGSAGSEAPGALERLTTERGDSNHVVGAIRAPSWEN